MGAEIWHQDRQTLLRARSKALCELPADWFPIIDAEARAARSFHMRHASRDDSSAAAVWLAYLEQFGGAAAADLSDAEIKAQAKRHAEEADDLEIGFAMGAGAWAEYERLVNFCRGREVEPPPVALLLKGMSARVRCQYWWRRALRKMIARKAERGAMMFGLVSKPARQPYASNKAVFRRIDQNRRNAEALDSIIMENDEGYRRTLAELAATSTSNKAIRRGELMTRIRGCQEIADNLGHVGLFCTFTVPSRFHSTLRHGARNPKHDGSTPRDAQKWLCNTWQLARAKLARQGVKVYGFRVAEPHHDGCTHWHMLIWAESAEALATFQAITRAYWLKDCGDEKGADKYRVNFKLMDSGGAAAYVAKYISKNIDDHDIKDHLDDYAEGVIGPDLIGDLEIKPCHRVDAWASTWGIRQFQPLGQPPVTVWRELRRVTEENARRAGVGGVIHKAWQAVQKNGAVLADWARYVNAQGGLMRGRKCRIVMRHEQREIEGRYGLGMRAVPLGVAINLPRSRCVFSERRLWRAVESVPALGGALGKRSAPARTRVNNCTAQAEKGSNERENTNRSGHGKDEGGAASGPVSRQDNGWALLGADCGSFGSHGGNSRAD